MQKILNRPANSRNCGLVCLLTTAFFAAACDSPAPVAPVEKPDCTAGSHLDGTLHGAINTELDWQASDMACTGMPRPAGQGARVRFAGTSGETGEDSELTIILAMPYLVKGAVGDEQPTRVTIIEGNESRFFSNQETASCWTDIEQHSPQQDANGATPGDTFVIRGLLYCVDPLPELNGSASVTLGDIHFSGQLSWSKPK